MDRQLIFSHEVFFALLLRAFNLLATLLSTLLLARTLGPEAYGQYSQMMAISMFLALPIQAGLPQLVVREIAMARAKFDSFLMKEIWGWSIMTTLVFSVITGTLVLLLSPYWKIFGFTTSGMLVYLVGLPPLLALSATLTAALRGTGKVLRGLISEFFMRPLAYNAFLLVDWLTTRQIEVQEAIVYSIWAYFSSVAVALWFFSKILPIHSWFPSFSVGVPFRNWLKSILLFSLLEGSWVILTQGSILLLSVLSGSESVANFKVTLQMASLAMIGFEVGGLVLAPRIARLWTLGRKHEIERIMVSAAKWTWWFNVLWVSLFLIYGHSLIFLAFGPEYLDAYSPLLILLLSNLVRSPVAFSALFLNMSQKELYSALVTVLSAIVNLGVGYVLIPSFSVSGAAVALGFSLALRYWILWTLSRKILNTNGSSV
ncbi:MAG: oligosaccharide flippase family protein [Candidatus Bipolaricaulaceae bacterium]